MFVTLFCHSCYKAGEDYEDLEGQVLVKGTIGNGLSEYCYNVSIINDIVTEFNQNFTIILSSSESDANISNNVSVVTIIDDGDRKKQLHI